MTGTPDLIEGFKALDASRDGYLASWSYYAGNLPEKFASERIQQLVEKSADAAYRFRFAKVPVNTMKNRVQVAAITGPTEAITAKIEDIRRANDMDMVEPFIHERTFVYGDSYALTWPVDPEDEARPEDLRDAGVEITYQSPLSCRAMYDAEDGLRLRYVIRRWKVASPLSPNGQWYAELYYPEGTIETWKCVPGSNGIDLEQWTPDEDAALAMGSEWPVQHEWGMPIHHSRNSLPYGRPEHADAFGPQDALTKAILTQVVVDLEAHGWRERWELLDDKAMMDAARDAVPWDDNTKAPTAVPAVKGARGRKAGPGTVHVLEGRKATGEYSAPNPAEIPPVTDQWLRMLSVVTETPAYEYDPAGNSGLTGIARMWADKPLAAREKNAKRYLLRFYRELWTTALRMAGVGEPGQIEVSWARPEPIADPDWWEVATVRRDHGVPQDVILKEANYAPELVEKWLDDQGEAMAMVQRIKMVRDLADAFASLGSAVALGVVQQTDVDALVGRIMGEATTAEIEQ